MAHTLRHGMTRTELAAKIELFEAETKALRRISTNCTVCVHGQRQLHCDKWGTVPAQVWPIGCPEWIWDEIPF
ncbi:BRCT domain containing protein [uncultured Caudovirales phage]|uniref:BRCT domain containing protein n=1 Tax=uncultured Caudovirales phage TaxID=2100421 RepID=A0A6J5RJG3_9CAUD|nr:BRCT domain containing protein [uncultured Caudovirales phage]